MAAADDETGAKLTESQLRANVMTFMLAGHETTSVTLSWVLYLSMSRNTMITE
jgi:cytochrome P450